MSSIRVALTLLIVGGLACIFAQNRGLLSRRYREGERLAYRMKAVNEGRRYEVRARGVVKKDSAGKYIEEYGWSDWISDGAPLTLPPAGLEFRQILSLDPDATPPIPDLTKVPPRLIGPITDMMTFYVDLWLAVRSGKVNQAGDHLYHQHGTPASWADGNYTVLGEDSIDFDITLTDVDKSNRVATVMVRHVVPKQPKVKLPADWMREPVAGTPNNWVNVVKKDGKYVAAVGKETFDVEIKVSLVDGKILSGTMDNPVIARERDCTDAALASCSDPRPHEIRRRIEIALER